MVHRAFAGDVVTSPYAHVQAAVAGYASASGATAPGGSPGPPPPQVFVTSDAAVGVYDAQLGALVARYPAVGYGRLLECLAVTCGESRPVHVYIGAATPAARITSYGDGSLADYSPGTPRYIPPGAPLLVVWEVASSTSTASCNAQMRQAGAP